MEKTTVSLTSSGSISIAVKITARNRIIRQGNFKGTECRTFHKMDFQMHTETHQVSQNGIYVTSE